MALQFGQVSHLLNPNYKTDVTRWLAEDCPSLDYGGFVVGDAPGEAKLLGKSAVSSLCFVFHFLAAEIECGGFANRPMRSQCCLVVRTAFRAVPYHTSATTTII